MQSSIAYSSATRIGGFDVGSVAPICTMATSRPFVPLASTLPIRLGLGMKPYAFWWCSLVHTPSKPARAAKSSSSSVQLWYCPPRGGAGQLPPGRRHPHGRVALLEIGGQLPVRHQMERADLHGLTSQGSE